MKIIYDAHKNEINISKHQGISLGKANEIDWDSLYAKEDKRFDYGERRMIGYALIGERLYCVVYTDRGNSRRVISLRKANKREVKDYVLNN